MDEIKTEKHVITQEDLDLNPDLVNEGVEVGDEVELPAPTETDIIAEEIHAAAIAAGKTDEEALRDVEAFYKSQKPEETSQVDEPVKNNESIMAPEPQNDTVNEAPVVNDVVAEDEVLTPEKPIPDVVGRFHDGKELEQAYWNGEKLNVRTIEGTTFTFHGAELEEFMKKMA